MFLSKKKKSTQIISWSLYDFANQPYTTLIITFIYSAFFLSYIAPNVDDGTFLWTNAIAISAIFVALISPILGAFADNSGYRKFFLIFFTIVCSIFTALLYFPEKGQVYFALILVVISNIAFEMGTVFCNSYLKDLSTNKNVGKVSGFAWGLGFVGGLLALLLVFIFLAEYPDDKPEVIKLMNIFVGLWFLIFSMPAFFFLKDKKRKKITKSNMLLSFQSLSHTFKEISQYKKILNFLVARLFYNDGLVTIFVVGGIYAKGTLGFSIDEVVILGVVLNVFAAIGSFLFGFLEDSIGVKKVINISLIFLIIATLLAFVAPMTNFPKAIFWIAGILIGTMVGPTQSCSRSYMSQLIPDDKKNEFFGFFAFTGKATSFLGPLLFGLITKFHSQQYGLLSVIVFFIIGLILFNRKQEIGAMETEVI
jgi:UMF1 family MFS transporter|tara:strand:+ start:2795 stop:4060 length:1266 start_codon:yes stop_codon:yes gene_type:complete